MADILLISNNFNNNVLKYDGNTGVLSVFATGNNLLQPQGLALDTNGRLYVANNNNQGYNILRFNGDGTFDRIFAAGQGLGQPNGIAFDNNGKLCVSNPAGPNVLRWNADGTFDRVFAQDPNLVNPQGIAFGENYNLYVVNNNQINSSVLRFRPDGTFDRVFTTTYLGNPIGIVVGSTGVGVCDSNRQAVLWYDLMGVFQSYWATAGGLTNPVAAIASQDGDLYVTGSTSTFAAAGFPKSNSAVWNYDSDTGAFKKIFVSGSALNYPTYLELL
jgi:sugar lactone lactonase YvrE